MCQAQGLQAKSGQHIYNQEAHLQPALWGQPKWKCERDGIYNPTLHNNLTYW